MKRRTVVRALVGLGIGIPVALEGATLMGLLFGDGGSDDAGQTTAASTGSTVLPETDPTERLTTVESTAAGVRVVVEVVNSTSEPYELRLTGVETTDGDAVDGTSSTGRVASGESASVTGEWPLPADASVAAARATAVTYGANAVVTETYRVPLDAN